MIQCIVGPRYMDRLVFTAVLVLGPISLVWAVAGIAHVCAGRVNRNRDSKLLGSKRLGAFARTVSKKSDSWAIMISVQILFLLYPLSCTFVVRTWVCDEYNVNGKVRWFMADDKSIECIIDSTSQYSSIVAAAIALFVIIVLGMPTLQYLILRHWRKPFDRLFVPTEKGDLVRRKYFDPPSFRHLLSSVLKT